MRPEGRIDAFLKALGEEWKRQSPDLRFGQFLVGNGLMDEDIFDYEEYDLMQKFFPNIRKQDYVVWGTYGKNGDQPKKHVPIKDLSDGHISAILRTQKQVPESYRKILRDEQVFRRKLKINKLFNK